MAKYNAGWRNKSNGDFGSSIYFQWNYSPLQLKHKKGLRKELQEYFAETFHDYSKPFTPWRYGTMYKTYYIRATDNGARLTYTTRYAKYQYNIPYNHTQWHKLSGWSGGGGYFATDHWDKATWATYKRQIIGKVEAERRKLSR